MVERCGETFNDTIFGVLKSIDTSSDNWCTDSRQLASTDANGTLQLTFETWVAVLRNIAWRGHGTQPIRGGWLKQCFGALSLASIHEQTALFSETETHEASFLVQVASRNKRQHTR
eukprot:m.86149 g.86149  ORF g.86149 m.86149 type:complete len:116 (-) comp11440_c0_seq3:359-706(-)